MIDDPRDFVLFEGQCGIGMTKLVVERFVGTEGSTAKGLQALWFFVRSGWIL
jgi:hypothetical protein